MTHPDPKVRLEGDIQLVLLEAWRLIDEAVAMARRPDFGRSRERVEWMVKLEALRGCTLLACARLIDVHHIEDGFGDSHTRKRGTYTERIFKLRRARTPGESSVIDQAAAVGEAHRRFALLCPLGFPSMDYGLGRVAKWVERGEVEISRFFAVQPGESAKVSPAQVKSQKRALLLATLAEQDEMLARLSARNAGRP